ncbi:MAG: hypothetical protein ACK5C0_10480 [Candidatus Kapaibacterium sp.]|jgi:hypothetical protein|nr:hypothetical protein [Candidatus Kapabacteria bacterium]
MKYEHYIITDSDHIRYIVLPLDEYRRLCGLLHLENSSDTDTPDIQQKPDTDTLPFTPITIL